MVTVLEAGGRPASCAAVVGVDGLSYVAPVVAHPELRRSGYAGAAMRDLLACSLEAGLDARTWLHATEAGRPVYERMGYSATARYTVYGKHEQTPGNDRIRTALGSTPLELEAPRGAVCRPGLPAAPPPAN